MPAVATETHSAVNGGGGGGVGFSCSQFYRSPKSSVNSIFHTNSSAPNASFPCIPQFTGYDVTDNKTTNNTSSSGDNGSIQAAQAPAYKLIFTMNDKFHREDERLKTFATWPLEWMDKHQLAQTGMFYTRDADKVKCYFCEVEIGRWEQEDEPVPEHLRWSPNCPLLRRRTTNNVPISAEALNRILPPASYDICGANDIEVRPLAYSEGAMSTATQPRAMVVGGSSTTPACATPSYFPEYPEYAVEAARIRSFAEWPRCMKQKPEQLAEAGFFYTGVGDRVKCFSCGGGLMDWNDNDDPWEQHALWLSKCRFLKLMKEPVYIDGVVAKHKAQETEAEAKELAEKAKATETVSSAATQSNAAIAASSGSNNLMCYDVTAPAVTTTGTTDEVAQSAAQRICDQIYKATEAEAANTNVVANSERKQSASSSCSIPEEKLCKICYAGEYNTAFLPCGHVVACAKCASSVTKCPLCRKPFTDVMRVYFS